MASLLCLLCLLYGRGETAENSVQERNYGVQKTYFEKRFQDGLQRKAEAYPCKTTLLSDGKPRRCFFVNNAMDLRFSSPFSPVQARDMRRNLNFQVLSNNP